jgi:GcrA cell cycle regulator
MSRHFSLPWTDERIEALKTRWLAGESAATIARALGGTSRSAVIGKVHRLGLAGREAPTKPDVVPAGRPLKAPAVARQPHQNNGLAFRTKPAAQAMPQLAVVTEPTTREPIRVADLTLRTCSWIVRFEHENSLYCGDTVARGSYCARHAARAYVATNTDLRSLERSVRRLR